MSSIILFSHYMQDVANEAFIQPLHITAGISLLRVSLDFLLSRGLRNTHTHTHTHTRHTCTHARTHTHVHALSTQAQEHFPLWHLHCHSQSCILYHRVRPILVSVTTPLLLNMFSLCVCDLCMCACELFKLLDVLNFPWDK